MSHPASPRCRRAALSHSAAEGSAGRPHRRSPHRSSPQGGLHSHAPTAPAAPRPQLTLLGSPEPAPRGQQRLRLGAGSRLHQRRLGLGWGWAALRHRDGAGRDGVAAGRPPSPLVTGASGRSLGTVQPLQARHSPLGHGTAPSGTARPRCGGRSPAAPPRARRPRAEAEEGGKGGRGGRRLPLTGAA